MERSSTGHSVIRWFYLYKRIVRYSYVRGLPSIKGWKSPYRPEGVAAPATKYILLSLCLLYKWSLLINFTLDLLYGISSLFSIFLLSSHYDCLTLSHPRSVFWLYWYLVYSYLSLFYFMFDNLSISLIRSIVTQSLFVQFYICSTMLMFRSISDPHQCYSVSV